jgi:hypothetical protein
MNRTLKTLPLILIGLYLVITAFDSALDSAAKSATQSSLTVYDAEGRTVLAYNGDLADCKVLAKPLPAATPIFLHRT